jgi:hypothetical protein
VIDASSFNLGGATLSSLTIAYQYPRRPVTEC